MDYYREFDRALSDGHGSVSDLNAVLEQYMAPEYSWRGLHPFDELDSIEAVVQNFWSPFTTAFNTIQRREDIFLAGSNDPKIAVKRSLADASVDTPGYNPVDPQSEEVWVCSMGHLLALFDQPWLGIPPTGKMIFFRYAEFHCVQQGLITQSALFFDLLSVMKQAGHYPLPPETGVSFMYPGPKTHDGLMRDPQDVAAGQQTLALINRMVDDLSELNKSGNDDCPPELLAKTWHNDMVWYGPTGIGASLSIERYQQQHQYPFRKNLADKVFNGHVCRIAEGNYGAFFGWPNLSNTPTGGFLGLPGGSVRADMRVVDVYRRQDDKLAENWIFIDFPHYLKMQGLDVLQRLRESTGSR